MLFGIIAGVLALTIGLAFFSHISDGRRSHSQENCLSHDECENMQSIPTPRHERRHSLMNGDPISGYDYNREQENSMRR